MDEIQYFHSNNTWIDRGQVDVLIDPGIFVADVQDLFTGSLLMHTDSHEHKLTPQTFERICESMPHMLPTKRPEFCIGNSALIADLRAATRPSEWKAAIIQHHHTNSTNSTPILFVNLSARNRIKSWQEVYLAHEQSKLPVLRALLEDATIHLLPQRALRDRLTRGTTDGRTFATSPNPKRAVTISCPPNKCDILIARAELVDAMPENLLLQWSPLIIHIGQRHTNKSPLLTLIDSRTIGLTSYDHWMDDFETFASGRL